MKLLTSNFKLEKDVANYLVRGLALAPNTIGGVHVCDHATQGCIQACVLWYTGRTVMKPTRDAMIARKMLFATDRPAFERQLVAEIGLHEAYCSKRMIKPAVRLNVASDINWRHIAEQFSGVSFYDYTKHPERLGTFPDNYDLTYSLNEKSHWKTVVSQLDRGGNVAVVFSTRYNGQHSIYGKLPEEWTYAKRTYRVVEGDVHDARLREIDGEGVIVGLRFKGGLDRRAAAIKNGFCVDVGDGL